MLKALLLLAATVCMAYGAVYIANLEEKPEEFMCEEGCYLKDLNRVIKVGESAPSPSKCQEYNCRANDVQIETCGSIAPPCSLVINNTRSYPDCCQIVCPSTT